MRVHAIDSAGLVLPEDEGHIVATGSHGALLGGKPETAIKIPVFAALYNDADFGMDDAGIARLPVLDARGIAGACVSAWSARIGDGQSTYRDGFVTAVNKRAAQCGGEIGISAKELVARLVAARVKELRNERTCLEFGPQAQWRPGARRDAQALRRRPDVRHGRLPASALLRGVRALGLQHHLINDERCGAFAADAYARVTNRPGVCDATLGPGATNLVTGLVESLNAGMPLVAIVGDANREHAWKNMTQEARQIEILRPAVQGS